MKHTVEHIDEHIDEPCSVQAGMPLRAPVRYSRVLRTLHEHAQHSVGRASLAARDYFFAFHLLAFSIIFRVVFTNKHFSSFFIFIVFAPVAPTDRVHITQPFFAGEHTQTISWLSLPLGFVVDKMEHILPSTLLQQLSRN